MLMLIKLLGKGYIVWDKSSAIRYKIPAKGTVYAQFELSPEQIEKIRLELEHVTKLEPEFTVAITDKKGDIVAEVKKVLYIAKKNKGGTI
jgi:F0F1-type ATP synthase delta subunit